jgi:hypothetical protein
MAVRTFVTAGVAFAAASAVAATVAIAPPMSPRDVQVAKSTEVSLNALVTDPALAQLIDSYFDSGAAAVVQDLLLGIVGDGAPADLINGYFDTGLSEVVRQILVAANPTNAVGNEAINIFFNGDNPFGDLDPDDPTVNTGVSSNPALFGVSGLVYARLLAAGLAPEQQAVVTDFFTGGATQVVLNQLLSRTADPNQRKVITDFFAGGATQVVLNQLLARTSDPQQQQFLNDFFGGGASLVAYRQLGGDVGTPNTVTADPDDVLPTSTPYLSAFFGINNNVLDPEGTGSPGLSGAAGVVLQRLLAGNADSTQQSLIHGFFETGISEVIRQILVEPQAPPVNTLARTFKVADVQEDPAPVDLTPGDTELNAAANLKPVDSDPAPVIEKKAKIATEPVQAVQPAVAAAPVAPAVASPPPVQAPAPAAPVVVKTVDEDDTEDSNDVTDAMKTGNKVVVDPILITGANGRGPKAGEGSWGVFGQVADAIGKTIAGASAPKTSTGSTGAADGS